MAIKVQKCRFLRLLVASCLMHCSRASLAERRETLQPHVALPFRHFGALQLRGGSSDRYQPAATPLTPLKGSKISSESVQKQKEAQSLFADFVDRKKRMGFVKKVYSILSVQMLATAAVVWYMSQNKRAILSLLLDGGRSSAAMMMVPAIGSVALAIYLQSSPVRFRQPQNYILLGLFTLLESLMVGTVSMLYKPTSVLLVALQTGIAFLGLTLYAFQPNPKYDFTEMGQTLFGGLWTILIGSLLNAWFFRARWMEFAISMAAVVLFSAFIVHDTHLIMGGQHKQRLDSKEHIAASMILYMDIINLFLHLLRLLGVAEGGDSD